MNSSAQVQENQTHSRAVVWIDHLTAGIFSMGFTGVTPGVVHVTCPPRISITRPIPSATVASRTTRVFWSKSQARLPHAGRC